LINWFFVWLYVKEAGEILSQIMSIGKKVKRNYDLTPLATFKIGGRAKFFVIVKNKQELIEAVNWAKNEKLPWLLLAGGSNVLIIKKKISGLVIRISGEEYSVKGETVSSWAGTSLTKLAKAAVAHGLSGLEWALGIPGSVGGAVQGNAGAYGSDMAKRLMEVEVYDVNSGRLIKLDKTACGFAYRYSIFRQNNNLLIVNVKLKLAIGQRSEIERLAQKNLRHRLQIRPSESNAGCVFKNLEYKKLIKQNYALAKEMMAKGLVREGKVAAGYLIEQLGLKGQARGRAKISEKHANFIVNRGGATAGDVMNLINLVKRKIKSRYGINLQEEIQRLG
jgi:UDP-N-acetylmuramate dehydrogenase